MKHQDIIDKMTLEEKAAFLSGKNEWQSRDIERLGIPSIFCSDGPHGIRKQAGAGDHLGLNESLPATCFPTAATVANSWNEELGRQIGEALGEEASVQDVNILLGPGLNMKRSPFCGRNFEYFAEDPYLAGKMAAAYVKGIQSQGVFACPKHFAVNSQELRRMAMNSVLDERTLREIYLTGFEIAVKEGKAKTIMSSYNEVNGTYANENKHLLQEILRDEWGFDGIVVTDWGASNDHAKGVAAGSNLEMPVPGLDSAREVIKAVNDGTLTMEELDTCVDDMLDAVLLLTEQAKNKKNTFSETEHHNLARKAAMESAVLLKNEGDILPLKAKTKVALIGDFAVEPRYQGAGSSVVNATSVETMEKAIKDYDLQVVGVSRGYKRTGQDDAALKKEALDIAQTADVVLYCFGLDELSESEGLDRTHMRIPQNQIELLEAIMKVNANIVGIISAGSAIEMPWNNSCKAILHGYLYGQAGASAMLELIMGNANPSGRLNETYPIRYEDTPAYRNFPSTERTAEYREALYIGYRYYDTSKVRVQYPFGFGLSYTTFEYSKLQVSAEGIEVTVANTGDYDGAEVVQLYVGLPNAIVFRPGKELKGFKKVFIKAGESVKVTIPFDDKTFRYWNVKTNQWEIEMGNYKIMVGASVSDIRLTDTLEVDGTTNIYPYNPAALPYYYTGLAQNISDAEFAELLGHPIPSGKWAGKLELNDAICQMYYAESGLARFIYGRLTAMKNKSEDAGKPDLNILFIYNMPFRALAKMTGGMVSMEMAEGILTVVNGHFFKGMGQIIGGFFKNRKANKQYEKKLATK
ncbi:MAG: glycoside hydrolase family 3 C-terminal domain-containing protein [Lachnospiraceae bacterium]|nr:glycoside hydrolase family 3 C-terminal domain-containing protein [Lachnospiraceae bacterium]MDD3615201.1 glycoside hydrolase family 3 C-terminal domain-containing protein [Lachnospiraceae bacterium]